MGKVNLLPHQQRVMQQTAGFDNVADYVDMGGGKTFIGSEQMKRYGKDLNLIVCQKSKVQDWIEHFEQYYDRQYLPMDLTVKGGIDRFLHELNQMREIPIMTDELTGIEYVGENMYPFDLVGVINYELLWRRPELGTLTGFTLMLDESSMIANERSKRSRFILKNLHPDHVILLSGTPVSGKYEQLWSQCHLLGWNITKTMYWDHYIITRLADMGGIKFRQVVGYQNVDRLKEKLRSHGAVFMKAEEFGVDLPPVNDIQVKVPAPKQYRRFQKDKVVTVDGVQLIGDTTLTERLHLRQICSQYNPEKLQALKDLLNSTDDRVIVFYNFNEELDRILKQIAGDRPVAIINATYKSVEPFERNDNCVLLVQYQAGAMGLNLQKANRIIYFSLPERSELFEQSKARIHRIGQTRPCFYYYLLCPGTIEMRILETLKMRKDYTDALFKKDQERFA